MSNRTIDGIAYRLASTHLRQEFLRRANTTPVDELPALFEKWEGIAEQDEADRPRIEAIRDYFKANGHLPPEVEATLIDVTDEITALAGHRGAA